MEVKVHVLVEGTTFWYSFLGTALLDLGIRNRFVIDLFRPRMGEDPMFEYRPEVFNRCDVMEPRKVVVRHYVNVEN